MTATLPPDVRQVFDRFITCELTTVDRRGQPITWPVTPYYRDGGPCIDVTTGLGYPKKAKDAAAHPQVSLLFSDPTGSGLAQAPMVLVQGTADVDDRDLEANRDRYVRESAAKLPATQSAQPPEALRRWFDWYYTRIYVHVRPERVYVWPEGSAGAEPVLLDSHMEEVRSGHDEEPDVPHAPPAGGREAWDRRLETLGERHATAVVSIVAPDGFPFSVRVPVSADRERQALVIAEDPTGVPLQPGLACVAAHEHAEDFSWQRNFHVRGDLVEADSRWVVLPRKLVGGFELPPTGMLGRLSTNFRKIRRFRRIAKRELERRRR